MKNLKDLPYAVRLSTLGLQIAEHCRPRGDPIVVFSSLKFAMAFHLRYSFLSFLFPNCCVYPPRHLPTATWFNHEFFSKEGALLHPHISCTLSGRWACTLLGGGLANHKWRVMRHARSANAGHISAGYCVFVTLTISNFPTKVNRCP